MFRKLLIGGMTLSLAVVVYLVMTSFQARPVVNATPLVKIVVPARGTTVSWNTLVSYKISVDDKEDGNSAYDEIAPHEVLLQVFYVADSSTLSVHVNEKANAAPEPQGLLSITTLPCFNCHTANAKLIGPSFDRIAARYPHTSSTEDALVNKIMKGSLGTWGEIPMPPNPDVDPATAKEIVRWILKGNRNPDHFFLAGLEGSFRTKLKMKGDTGKGVYVLRASYTDHGATDGSVDRRRGQCSVVLKLEK
ncbi:c-type cytochrome [Chryseolinea lacunae]|uniref:Cytochrome c domain-containing protein n=1 Tax=Chryseolinea lacunae TaxID=2801331 RepID=A0ABS1KP38_9BACT|nr:c-type cytochrome [Chryseolinea lacunae]MBL0741191.1 hypothetical protein [Chryseolinea lacunae]